ncbi:hypothetical protein GWK47_039074 [Chionoecetes opilio]|uniref:Uncharacterized protein n=1 Tax=Chionoecetes opilio TaxID=41210 RepID=A0A8J4YMA6_CHIOP|nr:hypothetical protein GWK47_039074 [Chionoecetes opilio]
MPARDALVLWPSRTHSCTATVVTAGQESQLGDVTSSTCNSGHSQDTRASWGGDLQAPCKQSVTVQGHREPAGAVTSAPATVVSPGHREPAGTVTSAPATSGQTVTTQRARWDFTPALATQQLLGHYSLTEHKGTVATTHVTHCPPPPPPPTATQDTLPQPRVQPHFDVEWIGTGSTTTAGAEHRAWKLAPHTATFPTSTCSLRCSATSDQLENVLRGVGYTVLHISRDETLVSVLSFPPVFHCSESGWIPNQGTVPVSDLVVCSTNCSNPSVVGGKLHSFGAAVALPVFCAHSFWRILVIEEGVAFLSGGLALHPSVTGQRGISHVTAACYFSVRRPLTHLSHGEARPAEAAASLNCLLFFVRDVLFDRYDGISAKDHERHRRTGEGSIAYQLTLTSPLPGHAAIMKNKDNKRQLSQLLDMPSCLLTEEWQLGCFLTENKSCRYMVRCITPILWRDRLPPDEEQQAVERGRCLSWSRFPVTESILRRINPPRKSPAVGSAGVRQEPGASCCLSARRDEMKSNHRTSGALHGIRKHNLLDNQTSWTATPPAPPTL